MDAPITSHQGAPVERVPMGPAIAVVRTMMIVVAAARFMLLL